MRVLIVDDQPLARSGVKMMLNKIEEVTQVVEASGGQEAMDLLRAEPFDLMLLDLLMPGVDGFQVLTRMKNLGIRVPTVILTFLPGNVHARRLLSMEVNGVVSKADPLHVFVTAVRRVAAGGTYIPPELAEMFVMSDLSASGKMNLPLHYEHLTSTEQQVFFYLAQGFALKEVAERLNMAKATVTTYRNRLLKKMGLKNDVEIIHYAVRHGIL